VDQAWRSSGSRTTRTIRTVHARRVPCGLLPLDRPARLAHLPRCQPGGTRPWRAGTRRRAACATP